MITRMGRLLTLKGEGVSNIDATISNTVYGLCSGRHIKVEKLAFSVGMSKSKIYSRLRGDTGWLIAEVRAVADYFDVRLTDLVDGIGGRFGPDSPTTTNPCLSGVGRVIHGPWPVSLVTLDSAA